MKKIFFALALAVVVTACHTNDNATLKEGQIIINASTRSEVATTSTEGRFTLSEVPATEDLKVEITGNGTTHSWASLAEFNTAVAEGLTFASAPHAITLSHGEKGVEGWSKPYFEGSATVEVPTYGLTVEANIEVVLKNSIIAIETTELFDGYFPTSTFKINGTKWDVSKQESLFMNEGEVTITCEAVRQTGTTTTLESKVTLKPTTRHTVVFDLSTAGNAKVSVTFDGEITEVTEEEFELNENA